MFKIINLICTGFIYSLYMDLKETTQQLFKYSSSEHNFGYNAFKDEIKNFVSK